MENALRVGIITTTHGIRGEVKLLPITDHPEIFVSGQEFLLDTGKETRILTVVSRKQVKQFIVLGFREVQGIEEAQLLKGKDLWIREEDAVPLAEGEYFIHDLIGLEVFLDTGERLGELTGVMETGANDVYIVEDDGREYLLPAIRECILDIDLDEEKMTVHEMPGLFDGIRK